MSSKPEKGGPTTQAGIYFQNCITVLRLAEMLCEGQLPPSSGGIASVRTESPEEVDDTVVTWASGSKEYIQAKLSISPGSKAWDTLWHHFYQQYKSRGFNTAPRGDKITLAVKWTRQMVGLESSLTRARTADSAEEWIGRLTESHRQIMEHVRGALGLDEEPLFQFCRSVQVWLLTFEGDPMKTDTFEEEVCRKLRGVVEPTTNVFSALMDLVGKTARVRGTWQYDDLVHYLQQRNFRVLTAGRELVEEVVGMQNAMAGTSSEVPASNGDLTETQIDYPQPGGTQPPGSPLYVRRAIDDVFERAVLRSGHIIIIRGHTSTGKSSLLASGLAHAKKAGRHLIRPNLQDAVRIAKSHPDHADDFFLAMATSIWWAMGESRQGSDCELPRRVWGGLSARNRLLGFVENYVLVNFDEDEQVVLTMDKVNSILNTSLGDDFYELMVTWQDDIVNNRPVWDKLTIVITLSTESYLLADDITPLRWPFGTVIDVPDFNQEEIQCLKQRYSDPQGQVRLAQVKVQDVARLLGGHPYLTHVALNAIAQNKVRDWQELNEIAVDEEHSPFREHLERRYDRIHSRPELGLVDALRQIVREHTCYDQMRFLRLESAGLVRRESQGYHCRYELYERYFSSRL